MLKSITKNDKPQPFAVLDIETDSEGRGTHFGYYDSDLGFNLFRDRTAFVDFLLANSKSIIYAHAGMSFDYSLLLEDFLKKVPLTIAYSSSGEGIFASVKLPEREITLADSYRLLPGSLSSLTDKFCPEMPKIDLSGQMPWELDEGELIEYLERDCRSLYRTIARFWGKIDETYGITRSLTLSSLAMKLFRKRFMHHNIMCSNKKLESYERESYFGGACWCKPGVYDRVSVFDVNSMYPFSMTDNEYPTSYVGSWTREYKGRFGLYKGKFRQPKYYDRPFIYDLESKELAVEGECIIDHQTIDYLTSIGGSFECEFGYIYYHVDDIFSDYVTHFYNLKRKAVEPDRTIYKLLLNSLYGKFGQRRSGQELSNLKPKGLFRSRALQTDTGEYIEIFDYDIRRIVRHSFPAIAALVTLNARRHLHQLMQGFDGEVIYYDTDSLHVIGDEDIHTTDRLGGLKCEYRGRGIYVAKKIYDHPDTGDLKCKGVPGKALRSVLSTYEGLDGQMKIDFDTFTSIRQQIKTGAKFGRTRSHRTIDFRSIATYNDNAHTQE